MKIVSVCNQKGGVGKTTTSITLSSFLGLSGHKTLLVDLDPQGNSTSGMGVDKNTIKTSVYHVVLDNTKIDDAIIKTQVDGLDLLPSNIDLTGAEVELSSAIGREIKLKKSLAFLADRYEYVVIDCPPSLGLLTINALTASESVIIPIQCEYYALEGLSQLVKTIDLIRDNLNPSLHIEGILMTMADNRTNLTNQVINEVKKYFADKTYNAVIPRNIKVSEAPGFGKPIMLYDKDCPASIKYFEFTREFLLNSNQNANPEEINNRLKNIIA